jgi:hypothetical protein
MSNEIKIVVTGRDESGPAMTAAAAGQKKVETAVLAHRKAALDAADADAKLQAAQAKVADVADKVRSGELAGADAMAKSSAAARDLERASIRVEESHRKVTAASHDMQRAFADTEKSGGLFSRMFSKIGGDGSGMFARLTQSAQNAFSKIGDEAGLAGAGVSKAFEGGLTSPIVLTVGIPAALAALPVLAAAASAGITLAFGAGLAGLGMMFALKGKDITASLEKSAKAAKDPMMKAFLETAAGASKALTKISEPFKETWKTIGAVVKDVGKAFIGPLRDAFKEIAPAMSAFFKDFGSGLKNLAPTVKPLAAAFSALMGSIGPQLPAIFKQLAQQLTIMFNTVGKNPQLFAEFIVDIMKLVVVSMKLINFLDKIYVAIAKFEGLKNPFDIFVSMLTPVLLGFVRLKTAMSSVTSFFGAIGTAAESTLPFFDMIGKKFLGLMKWFGKTYKIGLGVIDNATKPISKAVSDALNFAKRRYRATLSALNSVGSAVSSAVGAVTRFARGRYQASLTALNNVWQAFNAAMNLGRSWASKVFTATFNVLKNLNPFAHGGVVGGQAYATGGNVRGYASGGALAMVGEAGPEIVRLPYGSTVMSNPDSQRLISSVSGAGKGLGGGAVEAFLPAGKRAAPGTSASSGGSGSGSGSGSSGQTVTVKVQLEWVGSHAGDELFRWLRKNIRVRGGNVQKVLGQ